VKPKELVVVSGKGGTGKTTVVAALASIAARAPGAVLADCDVDVPDLHLVLAPVRLSREPFYASYEARIDGDRCSGCGECVALCRFGAIERVQSGSDGRAPRTICRVDPLSCEGCGLCLHACSEQAVELVEPQRGEIFVSDTRHGPLVHGRLAVGGENSGKLVSQIRERARTIGEETNAGLVLIDGPPGIGCPVIASVTGADLVLAVTEPTVSGLHDLARVTDLAQSFGRPLAVCINKSGISPEATERTRKFCEDRGVPVLTELSYDLTVVEAQNEGKSVPEHGDSPVARRLAAMWGAIEDMLRATEE
jgi:MinD superfamily P-loop ATPase